MSRNTLPPDPGQLLQTQSHDQSAQIALAQGMMTEAQRQLANVSGDPGSDEYVHAQQVAQSAVFFAGQQLDGATFQQRTYEGERHFVEEKNAAIMAVDKDRDGRSDYKEIQVANAAAPLHMLGDAIATTMVLGAAATAATAAAEGPGGVAAPAAAAAAATSVPAAAAPGLLAAAFTSMLGLASEKPAATFETGPSEMFNSRAWNQQQAFGMVPGLNMDLPQPTVAPQEPGPMALETTPVNSLTVEAGATPAAQARRPAPAPFMAPTLTPKWANPNSSSRDS